MKPNNRRTILLYVLLTLVCLAVVIIAGIYSGRANPSTHAPVSQSSLEKLLASGKSSAKSTKPSTASSSASSVPKGSVKTVPISSSPTIQSTTTPTKSLTNTGPGNVVALFCIVTLCSIGIAYWYQLRIRTIH